MSGIVLPDGQPAPAGLVTLISSYGGPESNCYVDLTIVTSFVCGIVDRAAWDTATQTQRSAAIVEGARDIDAFEYIGGRYYYNQYLKFPRMIPIGFPWNRTASNSTLWTVTMFRMQRNVQQANCWQALHILRHKGKNRYNDAIAAGLVSKSAAIGQTSETLVFQRGIRRLCPEALELLHEWRTSKRALRG